MKSQLRFILVEFLVIIIPWGLAIAIGYFYAKVL